VIDSDTLKGSDVYELIPLVDLVLARTLTEEVNNRHKEDKGGRTSCA